MRTTAVLSSSRMAKSKKGSRNIVVGDVAYRWRAIGNDGWISLTIWPSDLPGPTIACTLGYHQTAVPIGNGAFALTEQIVITSGIVRRVIEHAVEERGYDPRSAGKQIDLRRVDEVIDLSGAVRSA